MVEVEVILSDGYLSKIYISVSTCTISLLYSGFVQVGFKIHIYSSTKKLYKRSINRKEITDWSKKYSRTMPNQAPRKVRRRKPDL